MPNDVLSYITRIYDGKSDESEESPQSSVEVQPEILLPRPYLLSTYYHNQTALDERSSAKQASVNQETDLLYDEFAERYRGLDGTLNTDAARVVMLELARCEILEGIIRSELPSEYIIEVANVLDKFLTQNGEFDVDEDAVLFTISRAIHNYNVYMGLWNSHALQSEKAKKMASEMIIAYERIILAVDPSNEYVSKFKSKQNVRTSNERGSLYLPSKNSFKFHPAKFGGQHLLLS